MSVFQYLDVLHRLLAQLLKPAGRQDTVLKTHTQKKTHVSCRKVLSEQLVLGAFAKEIVLS